VCSLTLTGASHLLSACSTIPTPLLLGRGCFLLLLLLFLLLFRLLTQNTISANSINVGRFLPQVVFAFSAYAQLLRSGALQAGDVFDMTVPTGNFGNIFAGFNPWICLQSSHTVLLG
jgi:hypothetical protein